jgi:pyruvate formate lyase activating enzyme
MNAATVTSGAGSCQVVYGTITGRSVFPKGRLALELGIFLFYNADMKEAILYSPLKHGIVRCDLCAHRCLIAPGERGFCNVRENRDGTLYSLTYDRVIATAVDPIEKKPLYHFKPGSRSYSIATTGCNFTCSFCQNHHISQHAKENGPNLPGQPMSPEILASEAHRHGCATIAFTYTEPTIFAELAHETARAAKPLGVESVLVTNGYMTPDMLDYFGDLIAAANVDLKAFRDDTYRRETGGRLAPVLRSIEQFHARGTWLEVTTLVIPGMNDDPGELREAAEFLANLSPDIPWHLSAFHPDYRMGDRDRTPPETLLNAWKIGRAVGLKYIYTGNLMSNPHNSTDCPGCGKRLISRDGYHITDMAISKGRCPGCGQVIAGVF